MELSKYQEMWIPGAKWIIFSALSNTPKSKSYNQSHEAVHAKETTGVFRANYRAAASPPSQRGGSTRLWTHPQIHRQNWTHFVKLFPISS